MNIVCEVLTAIENDDLKRVRRLLKEHPYLFHFDIPYSWPVLHRCLAKRCVDLDLVKMYITNGGDVNRRTNSGVSLTFLAATISWNKGISKLLISNGGRMSNFERGVVALTTGLNHDRAKAIISELVNRQPELVHCTGDDGLTLLHHAITNFHYEIVPFLLERGADPNALTCAGKSPLGLCGEPTEKDGMDCYELLASKGAFYTTMERLIKMIRDDEDEEAIRVLKKEPRLLNAWYPGADGPLLHAAVWHGKSEKLTLIQYLLSRRVDPNVPNEEGQPALHRVMHRGPFWHPGDDNAVYETRRRAKLDLIHLLLQHGANINQQDRRGYTPLHEAAAKNQEEAVKLLVEMGAAINAKTNERKTVLDIVYGIPYLGHRSLAHWLKTKGAVSGKARQLETKNRKSNQKKQDTEPPNFQL